MGPPCLNSHVTVVLLKVEKGQFYNTGCIVCIYNYLFMIKPVKSKTYSCV